MDNTVVAPIMHRAKQKFLSKNRDLVAVIRGGANELFNSISADMMLDDDAEIAINNVYAEMSTDESNVAGDALTHRDRVVRTTAQGMLEREFFKQLCLAYLRLRERGAIVFVTMTREAGEQEIQLEVDAGVRQSQAVIERQAQEQVAAESLDEEITKDWNGRLRLEQVRAKGKANPTYGARLEQLLNEGKLQ